MEPPSVIAILAILALFAATLLADKWLLPRLLPDPTRTWTPRDVRKATAIAIVGMAAASIYVLVVLALAFR